MPEQGRGTQSNRWGIKDLWPSASDSGRIKPGSETVNNPDPDPFRPQNQRSRTHNPTHTRPHPPGERGWADKADSRPPLRGPGGWGGDWYVWHAPDGLRDNRCQFVISGDNRCQFVISGNNELTPTAFLSASRSVVASSRCQFIIIASLGIRGNPVSVHHSCPKR